VLLDLAHDMGFKGVISDRGASALALARRYRPVAVTLDINLPDLDGWRVLDALKNDPETRHIPVHIVTVDEDASRGLHGGAFGFTTKPVSRAELLDAFSALRAFSTRATRRLLVVEDNAVEREAIVALIGNGDVVTTAVSTGKAALAALERERADCVVLDLSLPDMTGFAVLDAISKSPTLRGTPVIVYTSKDLTRAELTKLQKTAKAIVVKSARSPERLVDETALFLHRVHDNLPAEARKAVDKLHPPDAVLAGKQILIVDDDIRNIFALTGVLEQHGMEPVAAENGREALEALEKRDDIDLVLMDIMMPEMDGYETMALIRAQVKYAKLPIIALTAKAMKGDREACLKPGASDYVTKPVDTDQLLSLLRVWLQQ